MKNLFPRSDRAGDPARVTTQRRSWTLSTIARISGLALTLALVPAALCAQPSAPISGSTLKATSSAVDALCVGCPATTQVPAANSGGKLATITLTQYAAPTITTDKLYNVAGALYFNGVSVATGSSISGTANTIGLFTGTTVIGNSLLTQSGSTVTMAGTLAATTFSGSGASLTGVPTTGVTGNFVATVASGTGITSSVTTGNAAATTITLNNTAVTPGSYGSALLVPVITIDQQGRITTASTVTPSVAFLAASNTFTAAQNLNVAAGSNYWQFLVGGVQKAIVGMTGAIQGDSTVDLGLFAVTSQGIAFYTGGSGTRRGGIDSAGNFQVGGTNVTDAVATPTIASGFGTSPAIAGKDFGFTITIGTGGSASGVVTFNQTYANAPICTANPDTALAGYFLGTSATTTQVTVASNTTMIANTRVQVLCRGY